MTKEISIRMTLETTIEVDIDGNRNWHKDFETARRDAEARFLDQFYTGEEWFEDSIVYCDIEAVDADAEGEARRRKYQAISTADRILHELNLDPFTRILLEKALSYAR